MVCAAVPKLGALPRMTLARPMLFSAIDAFQAGRRVESAARLKEAIRRHLAGVAERHNVDDAGPLDQLFDRLSAVGLDCLCLREVATMADDVLAVRDDGRSVGRWIEWVFELIDDDNRNGGAA